MGNADQLMQSSMRDAFLNRLYDLARENRDIVLLTNDFGAPALDKFRRDLPAQFVHIGIAEANLVNVSAGLAMSGKRPYLYSISPFVPLRCLEQLRIHMGFRRLPMTVVVVGAGFTYDKSGPTHHSLEDLSIACNIPGVGVWNVSDAALAAELAYGTSVATGPNYLRFDRATHAPIYDPKEPFSARAWSYGNFIFQNGSRVGTTPPRIDLLLAATGEMTHEALAVAQILSEEGKNIRVLDIFRLSPLERATLIPLLREARNVASLEENFSTLGDMIACIIAETQTAGEEVGEFRRFCVPRDRFLFEYSNREALRKKAGIDRETILNTLRDWLK